MEAKEGYRFIRPVLEEVAEGRRHAKTLMPAVLRFMDEAWGYVDKDHPAERLGMDLERIVSLILFVAERKVLHTCNLNHQVTAQGLYECYYRWVGPKKFRTMNREEFVRTVGALFPWSMAKIKGRRTFLGIYLVG